MIACTRRTERKTTERTNRPNERDPSPAAAPNEASQPTKADHRRPEPEPPTTAGTRDNKHTHRQRGRGKEDKAGPDHDTAQAQLFAIRQGRAISRAMPGQGS